MNFEFLGGCVRRTIAYGTNDVYILYIDIYFSKQLLRVSDLDYIYVRSIQDTFDIGRHSQNRRQLVSFC
jgi:hypothetical protein